VRVITEAGRAGAMLAEPAHDLDLLVMGSRDLGAVRRVVLGSVSTHVVRHAPCPVIVALGHATAERADDVVTSARTTD
jgi:nucleotide-binding universal stress UspA family protein